MNVKKKKTFSDFAIARNVRQQCHYNFHRVEKKCLQYFSWKTWREEGICKT